MRVETLLRLQSEPLLMANPRRRRLQRRRVTPDALRVLHFPERIVVQLERRQLSHQRIGRWDFHRRDVHGDGLRRGRQHRLAARREECRREAAVVRVPIVGHHQAIALVGRRRVVQLIA